MSGQILTRPRDKLSESEHEQVRQIEKGCSEVRNPTVIVRDFSEMIRNRDCLKWENWL
jgi:hypothetical protein